MGFVGVVETVPPVGVVEAVPPVGVVEAVPPVGVDVAGALETMGRTESVLIDSTVGGSASKRISSSRPSVSSSPEREGLGERDGKTSKVKWESGDSGPSGSGGLDSDVMTVERSRDRSHTMGL